MQHMATSGASQGSAGTTERPVNQGLGLGVHGTGENTGGGGSATAHELTMALQGDLAGLEELRRVLQEQTLLPGRVVGDWPKKRSACSSRSTPRQRAARFSSAFHSKNSTPENGPPYGNWHRISGMDFATSRCLCRSMCSSNWCSGAYLFPCTDGCHNGSPLPTTKTCSSRRHPPGRRHTPPHKMV